MSSGLSKEARVIDLGAGDSPDPRATEAADVVDLPGIDHQFDLDEDWPLKAESADGLVMNHSFEHVSNPVHAFEEAGRVLKSGGWLDITVPVGDDWFADPSHKQMWTWATPTKYCQQQSRHWDTSVPFILVSRDLDVRFFPPFHRLSSLLQQFARYYPAEAIRRCSSGEITARYRRVER